MPATQNKFEEHLHVTVLPRAGKTMLLDRLLNNREGRVVAADAACVGERIVSNLAANQWDRRSQVPIVAGQRLRGGSGVKSGIAHNMIRGRINIAFNLLNADITIRPVIHDRPQAGKILGA